MAKKHKPMKFYTLKLNEEDIDHLRWVLENDAEMHQNMMDDPPEKGQKPDAMLEDWVMFRDMKVQAMKIIQMIDKVYKPRRK